MKMGTHEHIVKLVVCATDPLKNSCCIRISTVKVGIVFIREQIVLSRTCIKYPILGKKKKKNLRYTEYIEKYIHAKLTFLSISPLTKHHLNLSFSTPTLCSTKPRFPSPTDF